MLALSVLGIAERCVTSNFSFIYINKKLASHATGCCLLFYLFLCFKFIFSQHFICSVDVVAKRTETVGWRTRKDVPGPELQFQIWLRVSALTEPPFWFSHSCSCHLWNAMRKVYRLFSSYIFNERSTAPCYIIFLYSQLKRVDCFSFLNIFPHVGGFPMPSVWDVIVQLSDCW